MAAVDGLHDDATVMIADELFGDGADFDFKAFLDHELAEAEGGGEEEEELEWLSNKDAFPTVETIAAAPSPVVVAPRTKGLRQRGRAPAGTGRRCRHCETTRTPQWRGGPEGPGTLCNACGIRYRSGQLLQEYRPESSPTFSPELHSNRHRRVVEMHRRGELLAAAAAAAASDK